MPRSHAREPVRARCPAVHLRRSSFPATALMPCLGLASRARHVRPALSGAFPYGAFSIRRTLLRPEWTKWTGSSPGVLFCSAMLVIICVQRHRLLGLPVRLAGELSLLGGVPCCSGSAAEGRRPPKCNFRVPKIHWRCLSESVKRSVPRVSLPNVFTSFLENKTNSKLSTRTSYTD